MQAKFDFGIAGIGQQITGPEDWIARLRRRWPAWSGAHPGAWTVELIADPALPAPDEPLFNAIPRCRDGECSLAAPGFRGEISAKRMSACLRAHPQARAGDLGYFIRVAVAVEAFISSGLLFHSAGVVYRDRGFALFGLSGSGKTTASRLSAPFPVLSDDLLLLQPDEAGWRMHATPFSVGRGDRRSITLNALLSLVQDREVYLDHLPSPRALAQLVANSPVISGDLGLLPDLMTRWERILATVPAFELHFRKDPSFWEAIDVEFGDRTEKEP